MQHLSKQRHLGPLRHRGRRGKGSRKGHPRFRNATSRPHRDGTRSFPRPSPPHRRSGLLRWHDNHEHRHTASLVRHRDGSLRSPPRPKRHLGRPRQGPETGRRLARRTDRSAGLSGLACLVEPGRRQRAQCLKGTPAVVRPPRARVASSTYRPSAHSERPPPPVGVARLAARPPNPAPCCGCRHARLRRCSGRPAAP